MTRGTLVALFALLILIGIVIYSGLDQMERERDTLIDRFAFESLQQVERATAIIRDELNRISEDLRFAGQLTQTARTPADKHAALEALLVVVRKYEVIHVYGDDGRLLFEAVDPNGIPEGDLEAGRPVLASTASAALALEPGMTEVTMPIPLANGRAARVFAMRIPTKPTNDADVAVVSLLVDTEPVFSKLALVASNPTSRILFLGTHGQPARLSDPTLASMVRELDNHGTDKLKDFDALLRRMRAGETGTARIGASEGPHLGFPHEEIIAAFAAVRSASPTTWSFATLNSTARVRAYSRSLVYGLAPITGLIALLLSGFGVYIVLEARRAGMMRQRLLLADRLGHLHEKLQKIVDNIPTGVIALSSEGKITMMNQMLREKISMREPRTLRDAFQAADAGAVDRMTALIGEAASTGRVVSIHGERIDLFGHEGQYSLHAVPLESRFDDARVLLVLEDQTAVLALSSQLIRAEKLATVGALAAGIAHEIGTPLGVVRGRAEYILGKLGTDHTQAQGMRVIVEQIDFVTRTIRQLLDFSRVRPVTAVHPVPVQLLARNVVELLRVEAERRKVTLVSEVPESLAPVAADPDQLQQVLVSLAVNALDACAQGGSVRISAREEEPSIPRRVRVEVADDGCGISKENRSQVFDPFFTTKKRGQGTGLGLTIAAQIVRDHGGEIGLRARSDEAHASS